MSKPRAAKAPAPAIAVVLVRPQEEGNVGAAARAMANMGLSRLVLVEPAVALGPVAEAFAVKARPLLARAERFASLQEAVASCARVIATTALRGRALPFEVNTARELAMELARSAEVPTALVFGPETSGLTSEELALATAVVNIPSSDRLPTLNLAQAVLILCYEIFQARLAVGEKEVDGPPRASVGSPALVSEVEGLFAQVTTLLSEVGFARDTTFAGVVQDLRQLAARSALTEREVKILRGICRRVRNKLRSGERARG